MLDVESTWVFYGSGSAHGTKNYIWLLTFGEDTAQLLTSEMDTFKMGNLLGYLGGVLE